MDYRGRFFDPYGFYDYPYPGWMNPYHLMPAPRVPVVPAAPLAPWDNTPPPIGRWDTNPVFEQDALARPDVTLSRIVASAQTSLQDKDYRSAMWKYHCAVKLCLQEVLEPLSLMTMRSKSVEAALSVTAKDKKDEVEYLTYAYREANLCIPPQVPDSKALNDSDSAEYNVLLSKLYFSRAEASRRLVLSGQGDYVPSTTPVQDAISDYCNCFAVDAEKNNPALMEAIVLAVDHKLTDGLPMLSKEQILDGSGANILAYIVQNINGRLKAQHLKIFLFNMVPPDVSTAVCNTPVKLSRLIKIGVATTDILNRMIQIGVEFKMKDIKDVVKCEEVDDHVQILDLAMSLCTPNIAQLKPAADSALHSKKYKFLACLIKHGAKPDVAGIIKILDPPGGNPAFLKYVLANGPPKKIAQYILKALTQQKCQLKLDESEQANAECRKLSEDVALLESAIQDSKTLCGSDAASGMKDIIAQILSDSVTCDAHMSGICLLLRCGANSSDLCQARYKDTTPLHAATALALELGSTDIISALVKCPDFTLPEDGKVVDNNGDCPYHLMVKSNREDSIKLKVGIALSGLDPPLDPTVSNTTGKDGKGRQAKECAGVSSEVFRCLVTAELKFALAHTSSESHLNGILSELKEARDIWECIDIMENGKLFREIVHVLEKVGMMEEALKQALKYEQNGTKLGDLSAEYLVHKYARLYSTQKDVAMLETCLAYIPDHTVKAKYWKRCGQYEKAIGIYREMNMHENAFRLMSCLGWYVRGLEMAKQEGDKKWIVNFAVEGAKALLHDHKALDTGTLECLQELLRDGDLSSHNKLLPIIHLLVGSGGGNTEHILRAAKMFGEQGNVIGELESSIQLLHLLQGDTVNCTSEVLRTCYQAQQRAKSISLFASMNAASAVRQEHIFQLALVFYGFQSLGVGYCLHPKQSIWAGDLSQYNKVECDTDGTIRLDVVTMRQFLFDQLDRLSERILEDDAVESRLQLDLCNQCKTQFYKQVSNCLTLNPSITLSAVDLNQYVAVYINWLEYCCTPQRLSEGPIRQLLDLFSPNVFPYLPPGLLHLRLVRSSTQACECIAMWLQKTLDSMATSEEECKADVWLMLWKASCMVGRGGEELRAFVKNLALKVGDDDVVPAPYLFLDSYTHQFDFWLQACDLICNNGEIIGPAEFVIKYFLSHIAATAKRGSQIMVMNVVEILSIYSTALLGVIAKSQHRQCRKAPAFVVPSLYQCAIDMFDELNTYGRGGYRLLDACVHQVDIWPEGDLEELSSNALLLLRQSLDLLIGVLKFSLYSPILLSSGFSYHCLTITLTILSNLATQSLDVSTQRLDIMEVLKGQHVQRRSRYITEALRVLSAPGWKDSVSNVVQTMANHSTPNVPGVIQLTCDQEGVKFIPRVSELCLVQPDVDKGSETEPLISKPRSGGDPLVANTWRCYVCNLHVDRTLMQEHITTTTHHEKEQLLLEYNRMEEECVELQQTLHAAILRLQDGDHHGNRSAKLIHDVEEEVERNGSIFDNIRWRSSWEEGVKELKQMKERVGMLRHQCDL